MPKAPYKRPNNISDYFANQDLKETIKVLITNYEPVTASNSGRKPFFELSKSKQSAHRQSIEKALNDSQDIKNLRIYLASIGLCLGNY